LSELGGGERIMETINAIGRILLFNTLSIYLILIGLLAIIIKLHKLERIITQKSEGEK